MTKYTRRTYRLAFSYFSIIMAMSLIFSVIIYFIASAQLNRPLPPRGNEVMYSPSADTQARIAERDNQTRISMLGSLAVLNIIVAAGGAGLSYYLARRTLSPIEASIRAQAQFVSDASHELRTPLTALQTSNEVALRKNKITEEKARDVFRRTIAETEKLRNLTNALLKLATADRESETPKTIRLDSFTDKVLERVQPLADKKKLTVTANVPSREITVQTSALEQIMTILLDNAIKYSSEKSNVVVTGTIGSHSVKLSVRDKGIGIGKKELTNVFERFYRANSARTRSDTSGHGLGLAIAKQLADHYGYTITCESEVGRGSTFTVTIPL